MKQEKVNNIMAYSQNRENKPTYAFEIWIEGGYLNLITETPINAQENVYLVFKFDDIPADKFRSKVANNHMTDKEIQLLIN